MHAIEFLRKPIADKPWPVYAVYGEEPFLRREVLKTIVHTTLGEGADELAVARFDGDDATMADVIDELRTLPFLAKARVVLVDGADPFVSAHRQGLEEYVGHPSPTGVLVLAVKSWPSNTKLAKLVQKAGLAIECKGLPERELASWLAEAARQRFASEIKPDAAHLLVELVGPELSLLVSELEKLATYVGEGGTIRRADVVRMVGAGRIETIWKALEAATTGETAEALHLLDRLIASGEHPVGLLAAMSASLRKVHHAGYLRLHHRRDLETACREAGIPAYPAAIQSTMKQHRHLGPGRVDELPDLLLRADLDLKGSSQLSPRAVMERLFVRLARPREEVET